MAQSHPLGQTCVIMLGGPPKNLVPNQGAGRRILLLPGVSHLIAKPSPTDFQPSVRPIARAGAAAPHATRQGTAPSLHPRRHNRLAGRQAFDAHDAERLRPGTGQPGADSRSTDEPPPPDPPDRGNAPGRSAPAPPPRSPSRAGRSSPSPASTRSACSPSGPTSANASSNRSKPFLHSVPAIREDVRPRMNVGRPIGESRRVDPVVDGGTLGHDGRFPPRGRPRANPDAGRHCVGLAQQSLKTAAFALRDGRRPPLPVKRITSLPCSDATSRNRRRRHSGKRNGIWPSGKWMFTTSGRNVCSRRPSRPSTVGK